MNESVLESCEIQKLLSGFKFGSLGEKKEFEKLENYEPCSHSYAFYFKVVILTRLLFRLLYIF